MFAGVRTPTEVVVLVVRLLSYGCPILAMACACLWIGGKLTEGLTVFALKGGNLI